MKTALLVIGSLITGGVAVLLWLMWYFRDVMK